jgi:hypothetical protein
MEPEYLCIEMKTSESSTPFTTFGGALRKLGSLFDLDCLNRCLGRRGALRRAEESFFTAR